MMLIDQYLSQWHFAKRNEVLIKSAPPETISFLLPFNRSGIIRVLFLLRGLPNKILTLKGFLNNGFILLDQNDKEMVIGLIAQPWKLKGNIIYGSCEEFMKFNDPDYAKNVWNFSKENPSESIDETKFSLVTETRIYVDSPTARKKLARYWMVIGHFSGIIRKEMLKVIKKEIERLRRDVK